MRLLSFAYCLLSSIVLSLIISCTGLNLRDNERISLLSESLERSAAVQNKNTRLIIESLKEKMSDPVTSVKAKFWFPKVEQINSRTTLLRNQVEKLKEKTNLTEADSDSLFKGIIKYKDDMLELDLGISAAFRDDFFPQKLIPSSTDSFYSVNFLNTTKSTRIATLRHIDYLLAEREAKLIAFCYEQPAWHSIRSCEFPSAIIGQNKSQLLVGQELEIVAGVGMFQQLRDLQVKVNDKEVLVSRDGVFVYKTVALNPGNYSLPVMVSFSDQDGKQQTISKDVEYKVVKPQ